MFIWGGYKMNKECKRVFCDVCRPVLIPKNKGGLLL